MPPASDERRHLPRAAAVAAALALSIATPQSGAQTHDAAGHWEGSVEVPGQPLVVQVDLAQTDGAWSGTIDIPAQGADDLPLSAVTVDGETVRFTISGVPGDPTFEGTLADGEISGEFTQGPARLPFRLGREAVEIEAPPRPQEPKPPFPYDEEDTLYQNGNVTIAGTLTLPPGDGRVPAALLISGSGALNRDLELAGHKPFLVVADHLNQARNRRAAGGRPRRRRLDRQHMAVDIPEQGERRTRRRALPARSRSDRPGTGRPDRHLRGRPGGPAGAQSRSARHRRLRGAAGRSGSTGRRSAPPATPANRSRRRRPGRRRSRNSPCCRTGRLESSAPRCPSRKRKPPCGRSPPSRWPRRPRRRR